MTKSELLLEHTLRKRSPWAIRFYQDGRVEEFSDENMTFENDQIVTRPQPPEWRPLIVLSDDELVALKDAIRHSEIFSLPERVGDPHDVHDGAVAEWYARLGDREKRLTAWEPQASDHPSLKELSVAIQTITASAFNRDSEE